jgi:hypothetical protein
VELGEIRSITSISSACCAEMLSESLTALSAQSPLRPRSSARLRRKAAASLVTFSRSMAPLTPTGWAAPTLVPGAMAATGQLIKMKVPAEAARAPSGET